jgi:caa(3)-type oxidase subunit IV
MSEHAHEDHSEHYKKVYIKLLVAFAISFIGPLVFEGMTTVVLIIAFAIAFYKAGLVIIHFMHLPLEKKYVTYLQLTMLIFMTIFVAAVSPDVHKHEGATIEVVNEAGEVIKEVKQWENVAAKQVIADGLKKWDEEKTHGGE